MNIALWIAQGLLAVMFGMSGVMKTFQTAKTKEQMSWAKNRSDGFVRFVGISEVLGAIGLILPLVTGILTWLTPLAAIGLALIQLLAIFTEHLPKKEFNVIPVNILLIALALFVVIGRWSLIAL
ncbi:MAG TPA: DoxX family protein [Anaerolineales bacterium]|nr:DoxX family protein [Anaerolineales bacterium]